MRIFGFNINRSSTCVEKTFDSSLHHWLRGESPDHSTASLTNAYEQIVWVYRAINVLSEQIGNIPFLFSSGERGRENLITSGPLVDFYDQPHPQINRFQYWELRLIWLMLRGECFRIPIYEDTSGRASLSAPATEGRGELAPSLTHSPTHSRTYSSPSPSTLSALHSPRRLKRVVIPDPAHFHHIVEDHQLIGWRYTGFGRQTPMASQVFLPEEVWFEKLPNPFNFWRGLAPLNVAGLAAQTDFAAGSFMKGVMENNGDLGLVVRMQEQASPEQREQLKAALRDRKRRAGTADGPLLLWNTAEIVQPHLSSGDLQFLENRKFSRSEICAAFGVPEEIVTTTDNSKYDVVSGARLNFMEHRVGPLCRRLEAGEDITVKALDSGAVGWFDLDSLPIMQKAQRDRLATARSVFDMGVPFNELNRVLDLGFRRLPWGDKGYIAGNLAEVGADSSTGKITAPVPPSTAAASMEEKVRPDFADETLDRLCGLFENLKPAPTHEPSTLCEGASVPIRHTSAALGTVNPRASFDSLLNRRLRRFFFEQRARVLEKLEKASISQSSTEFLPCLFDLATEMQGLEALKLPDEISADTEAAFQARSFLQQEFARLSLKLTDALKEGLDLHETREELANRVRATYNDHEIPKGMASQKKPK